MPHKNIAASIIRLIEARIQVNQSRGNSNPIVLTLTVEELKEHMDLERLKAATRNRLIERLEDAGYEVTYTGSALVIEVDPAERDCTFESLSDLEDSFDEPTA